METKRAYGLAGLVVSIVLIFLGILFLWVIPPANGSFNFSILGATLESNIIGLALVVVGVVFFVACFRTALPEPLAHAGIETTQPGVEASETMVEKGLGGVEFEVHSTQEEKMRASLYKYMVLLYTTARRFLLQYSDRWNLFSQGQQVQAFSSSGISEAFSKLDQIVRSVDQEQLDVPDIIKIRPICEHFRTALRSWPVSRVKALTNAVQRFEVDALNGLFSWDLLSDAAASLDSPSDKKLLIKLRDEYESQES